MAPTRSLAKRLGLERQWLHARSLAFAHRPTAGGSRSPAHPADLQARPGCAAQRVVTAIGQLREARTTGLLFGVGAYASWGVFPAFFPLLKPAGAVEVLAHRIVWTSVVMAVLLLAARRMSDLARIDRRTWLLLVCASALISTNWVIYVYAVNNSHVVDAALGYFVNPLVSVLLGVLIFRERLNRAQLVALLIALAAVIPLSVEVGDAGDRPRAGRLVPDCMAR